MKSVCKCVLMCCSNGVLGGCVLFRNIVLERKVKTRGGGSLGHKSHEV